MDEGEDMAEAVREMESERERERRWAACCLPSTKAGRSTCRGGDGGGGGGGNMRE